MTEEVSDPEKELKRLKVELAVVMELLGVQEQTVLHQTSQLESTMEHLERSNRELDDFTYIVSHDLKEPLRSVSAFSKFVIDDYSDKLGEEGRGYLERIQANVERMKRLIDDLLQVSRLSRTQSQLQEVDGAALIEEVKLRFDHALSNQAIRINVANALPTLWCDRVRLTEVFANLISNAIKYNDKAQCQIDIDCSKTDGGYYYFSVKDNGPGIQSEYFEKIFGIFQRLGKREDHEGTGIGLTIVKKIIELHKGKIWVESKLGEWTSFHFTLPTKPPLEHPC